jgi:hypothetical protein
MGGQRLVLMESVPSAQFTRRGSLTGMSVKSLYTIVLGLEGIPHKMKTQRSRFYYSRESERTQTTTFLSNKKTSS